MGDQKYNSLDKAIVLDERLLIPDDRIGERTRALAKSLASCLKQPDAEKTIIQILRLFAFDDDFTGLACPIGENTLLNSVVLRMIGPDMTKAQMEFVERLDVIIASEPILSKYPELSDRPRRGSLFTFSHLALFNAASYSVLNHQMQAGLIEVLNDYSWAPRDDQIEAVIQGFVGVMKIVYADEAVTLLQHLMNNDLDKAITLVETAGSARLTYAADSTKVLPRHTQKNYCWGFEKVIIRQNPICPSLTARKDGKIDDEAFTSLEDDDPAENSQPGDSYNSMVLDRVEREVALDLDPKGLFDSVLDIALAEEAASPTYLAGDYATLGQFPTIFDSRVVHLNDLAWFMNELGQAKGSGREMTELRCALATLPVTGRSLQFLLNTVLGEYPKTFENVRIQKPIFDPVLGVILFTPDANADIPRVPLGHESVYKPVLPFSILTIPLMLLRSWRALTAGLKKGDDLFRVVTIERCRQGLKKLSDKFQMEHPKREKKQHFTEARLRRTFSALFVVQGRLNRVLATLISDQRTLGLRPHLFYITISTNFLSDKFEQAQMRVWQLLTDLEPGLKSSFRIERRPKCAVDGNIGSGYYPTLDSIRNVVLVLTENVANAKTADDLWNVRTLLCLYLLSVLCGLRISEAGGLKAGQFDLDFVRNGSAYPLLNIPYSKGSRFAFSERTLPLVDYIVNLLKDLLPNDRNLPAFCFKENGQMLPATKNRIARRMKELSVPFPRWHSGRHLLASALLVLGAELLKPVTHLDACFILGHVSQGEEPFHPATDFKSFPAWDKYLQVVKQLMSYISLLVS